MTPACPEDLSSEIVRLQQRIRALEQDSLGLQQNQAEGKELLSHREEHLRRLIAASPDCLLELDLAGQILFINPRTRLLFGVNEESALIGRTFLDLWPDESKAALHEILALARETNEARQQVAGGTSSWWDVCISSVANPQGQVDRFLVSARDITQLKEAENEREEFQRNLLQTQKLESLGVMAGGIAHDFNNLLTGILGNADLVRAMLHPASSAYGHVEQIERSAERAADLCRQMLAYAGKGRFVVEPLDLSELVDETAQLIHLSVSKKATLTMSLARGLPRILADATQIRQVLLNLAINASEALGEQEGLIAVTTGRVFHTPEGYGRPGVASSVQPGRAEHEEGAKLIEGEYTYLEVSDTGSGMDQATIARIFEPFFTTKFTGRGLGLSAVLGIVRGHSGYLHVRSTPGKGSIFRLLFPPTKSKIILPRPSRQGLADWSGEGLVLLVDDEETVRHVAAELLRSFGFEVLEATDGHDAIRLMRERGEQICLVLLDLTMPRMDGEQTIDELHQLVLNVPVVLMSGYSERELSERFADKGLAGFLQKPFTREQMGKKLRDALQACPQGLK
jgi:PAS domain S-box-containing protein